MLSCMTKWVIQHHLQTSDPLSCWLELRDAPGLGHMVQGTPLSVQERYPPNEVTTLFGMSICCSFEYRGDRDLRLLQGVARFQELHPIVSSQAPSDLLLGVLIGLIATNG